MVKIIPLPHKDISKELNDDLRNKLSGIGLIFDKTDKAKTPQFAKMALKDLVYLDKKLERFELRNKLPRIKSILEEICESKCPSNELFKAGIEDYEYIIKVLDDLLPPFRLPPELA